MARERRGHQVEGGCCALVVVYLLGKVYVANAGDSRYGVAAFKKAVGGGGGGWQSTFWDGGVEENEVVGVKNQRLDGVRRDHRHKEWLEVTMRGKRTRSG